MTEDTSKENLTFEQAMETLERTVKSLESGQLPLTDSIERYKEAMNLVHYCRQQLDKAELEIEQLMEQDNPQDSEGAAE